ncbi:hypothetical protein AB0O01_16390 [Streptomyces sp. NPDC093252]|uniref:hypothetical protein n=1 Tax=Streptomyces sp. NPDC093252 TaxID=3154980 RepID=UPI003422A93D
MIEFLRERFATYDPNGRGDARFFRVNVMLGIDESLKETPAVDRQVRLYFLKENLYLEGWSILHNGTERYLAVDKRQGMTPLGLNDAAPRTAIPLAYAGNTSKDHLGADRFVKDLRYLHAFLSEELTPRPKNRNTNQEKAQASFHRIIRVTAEMARFGGFCKSFTTVWPVSWHQGTEIGADKRKKTESEKETENEPENGFKRPPFHWAVNNWDALSRKLRLDETANPVFKARPVTRDEAEQILKDGAPTHPR